MEFLKNYSIYSTEYQVIKSFNARPTGEKSRVVNVGERITFDEKTPAAEIVGWCRLGRLVVANLPQTSRYKARRPFSLRVGGRLEEIEVNEICEIKAEDVWALLLRGVVIPVDELAWSPARLAPAPSQKRKGAR